MSLKHISIYSGQFSDKQKREVLFIIGAFFELNLYLSFFFNLKFNNGVKGQDDMYAPHIILY